MNKPVRSLILLAMVASGRLAVAMNQPLACSQPRVPHDTWITIFVHGIVNIKHHLDVKTILKLMDDRVEGSSYQKRISAIRADPFFQRNHAIQGLGLIPVSKSTTTSQGAGASALAILFDAVYAWKLQQPNDLNLYYTFGWSGILSPSIRLRESQEFYQALKIELERLYKQGIHPKIRLVGYSHGGNIVLGLARAYQKDPDNALSIDEVILLGVPIQNETDHFVTSPLFKKIFHLYSLADRIQPLDYFSYKRFGSNRYFKPRSGFTLPKKLVQVELKLFRNVTSCKTHTHVCRDKRYDFDNMRVLSGRTHGLRNISPGHCELWFFGWNRGLYRKYFPLSPLPVVAILPYVIETVKEYENEFSEQARLVADIRLDQETLLLRTKHSFCPTCVIDFLSKAQLEELKTISRSFSHRHSTKQEFKARIRAAFEMAQGFFTIHPFDPQFSQNETSFQFQLD